MAGLDRGGVAWHLAGLLVDRRSQLGHGLGPQRSALGPPAKLCAAPVGEEVVMRVPLRLPRRNRDASFCSPGTGAAVGTDKTIARSRRV